LDNEQPETRVPPDPWSLKEATPPIREVFQKVRKLLNYRGLFMLWRLPRNCCKAPIVVTDWGC